MEIINNANTLTYMYRYLLKYVGTYRVKAEIDYFKNDFPRNDAGQIDESFDDLYIPCAKGVIKHTYLGNDILVVCFYDKIGTANNVYKELLNKYPKLDIEFENDGCDGFIYFDSHDINKIATIIKPRTSGAKINPFSNTNLPKPEYKIPSKDLNDLYSITKDLDRIHTMQFFKQVNVDFTKKLTKELKQELKQTRLGFREFIHSKNLWQDYVKFVTKSYSKYLKKYA